MRNDKGAATWGYSTAQGLHHASRIQLSEESPGTEEESRYQGDDEDPETARTTLSTIGGRRQDTAARRLRDLCRDELSLDSPLPETTITDVDFGTWACRLNEAGQGNTPSSSIDQHCDHLSVEDAVYAGPKRTDRYATFHGSYGSTNRRPVHYRPKQCKRRRTRPPQVDSCSEEEGAGSFPPVRNIYPYTTIHTDPRRHLDNLCYILPSCDPYCTYRSSWSQAATMPARPTHSFQSMRVPRSQPHHHQFKVYDIFNDPASPPLTYDSRGALASGEVQAEAIPQPQVEQPPPVPIQPQLHLLGPPSVLPYLGYDQSKVPRSPSGFGSSASGVSRQAVRSLDDPTTQRRCVVGLMVGITTALVIGLAIALFIQVNDDSKSYNKSGSTSDVSPQSELSSPPNNAAINELSLRPKSLPSRVQQEIPPAPPRFR